MPNLKTTLHDDLIKAMKAHDELKVATLRLSLAAVTTQEVAGAQVRELSDDEVMAVLSKEAKKRRESTEAFETAGRTELAARERAEEQVLARYLPTPLTDEELATIVAQAISETGADSPRQMGLVMKALQQQTAGRADGKRVSEAVRHALA